MSSSLLSSTDKDFQSAEKASFAVPDLAVDCSIFDRTDAVDSFVEPLAFSISLFPLCVFMDDVPVIVLSVEVEVVVVLTVDEVWLL